ncbi:hypothetical protein MalM25_23550 [Planctomycetes bacterium MalM25]|nr:hypothetical protein MalM25_23550 [Planctomycetes bacterium MalM25]
MQQQAQSAGPTPSAASLFGGYRPPADSFDEMLASDGEVRPAWVGLRSQLDRIGSAELSRRWVRSQRLIHENGVAYSAYGDPEERPRPWALDPAPLLVHESEWNPIAAGLRQRARLLESILQDLHGEQRLISAGVLPAELLYRHPAHRLPLQRAAEFDPRPMLQFYAADLGRSADGKWWVLADRTEAPSGIGFALENRIVTSRMLAEPFRDRLVKRLAPFFTRLRDALERRAPGHRPNPNIAILSQGPGHPNYFEDAYLARYLGYLLVEGGDLTVRERRLWMKTLDGLSPIDVLVRRPSTADCDPLELGGVSPSGVAGLLQAERDGGLQVINACGSGLVESPVFMAFMPRLCQALLEEPLQMPGVASWWCGEPESLDFVLENLDNLVLKRAYRQRGEESLLTKQLRETPRPKLIELIRREPHAYVAQEEVVRSTAPAWDDQGFTPVRVAMRAFAVAGTDGFEVMQGALARTTQQHGSLETSLLTGEGSKDVWVLGERPVKDVSLLPSEQEPVELVRIGAELPSRVADNSFWLGRYLERADAAARLVRIVTTKLTSEDEAAGFVELPALVRGLAEQGQIEPGHAVEALRDLLPKVERALPSEVLSTKQPGSLGSTVRSLFAAAAQVRDRLSRDSWRIILRINERFRALDAENADLTDLLNQTDELILDLSALGGMVVESMTRAQFYRFLDIGRRVERALQSIDLLRATLLDAGPPKPALLESLLEAADSLMTYRSRYRANLKLAPVLDLLLTDDSNPRSLAWQLDTLLRHVGKLPRTDESTGDPPEQRLSLGLSHAIRMVDVQQLAESYELGRREPLASLLDDVGRDLPKLANALALKYLAHAGPPRQLAPT